EKREEPHDVEFLFDERSALAAIVGPPKNKPSPADLVAQTCSTGILGAALLRKPIRIPLLDTARIAFDRLLF
ncbi:hypothetical protein, partial [Escherichia coli]|uniref:hypothetical protein n=1 Tax=Escherichia coli TaxID=562 RepID=UPI002360CC32